MLNIH